MEFGQFPFQKVEIGILSRHGPMTSLLAFGHRSRRFEPLNIDEKKSSRFVEIGQMDFPRVQIAIVVNVRGVLIGTFQMLGIFFF